MNLEALAADAYGHVMGGGEYFDQRINASTRVFACLSDAGFNAVLWCPQWPSGLWVTWARDKAGKIDVTPANLATWLRLQIDGALPHRFWGLGIVEEMAEKQKRRNPEDSQREVAQERDR